MRVIVIVLLCLFVCATSASPAYAKHRRHAEHHATSIITVDTAAGAIRVAADYATKFKNLIADFVAAGYNPGHVGCFATSGHVRNSRHYLGQACDFDQGPRPHSAFMRSVKADTIIHKYGFTNGCSFNDCGHVGTDAQRRAARYVRTDQLAHRHSHRYAHHHHRRTAMPEIDIHLRLASLEADVVAMRNFLIGEHGPKSLPPSRIDHPGIITPFDVGMTVTPDVAEGPVPTPPGPPTPPVE